MGAVLRVITCRQRRRRSLLATRLMQVSLHDRYVNAYRELSRVAFD